MLRHDVVKNIHEGHQCISKCRERAKSAVWWPGINQQLAEFVTKCPVCTKYRQINAEPMVPSNLPSYPWQKVGCELFQFNDVTYLLVVDYFSGYIGIAPLGKDLWSGKVINYLRSIFALHGIAEELRADNGPQFSSNAFAKFSDLYGFKHTTSAGLTIVANAAIATGPALLGSPPSFV